MLQLKQAPYYDGPPSMYLEQVLDHCPKAGSTYMKLWRMKDFDNCLTVAKSEIPSLFLIKKQKFQDDLLLLAKEQLINVDTSPNMISIEMVGWDIDAEGLTLC
jgi:hypothetical protein